MKKVILMAVTLLIMAGTAYSQSFADIANNFDEAERRRKEAARRQIEMEDALIDGEWDDARIHGSLYAMYGDGFGIGISFDWQPFRNFAWTFFDANYYAKSINVSSLLTATWRPFSFEVALYAGPHFALTFVKYDEPKQVSNNTYAMEESITNFSYELGVTVGINLGSGLLYIGTKYYDLHGLVFIAGYKLMGPGER